MNKYQALKKYFGYTSFREGQQEIIDAILEGRDAIGIMPTGAGKSVCFQLPALLLEGITIVISPLISLMKDQVNSLDECGIRSAYINNSLSEAEKELILNRARRGYYKIIYVAPERLASDKFLNFCHKVKISMVCIDEAHCVSQWGHDFRPSYLLIRRFVDMLENRPIVAAFTATATVRVREDIINLTGLIEPIRVVTGFDRKNLYFEVVNPSDKYVALKRYLDIFGDRSGIVYCSSRKTVEELKTRLSDEKYSVIGYHAGLGKEERRVNQELFINDEKKIVVATNAFGMGIDKSNVSFVIHYNMPGDIESYYQEAGRAGRDGSPADCILLYNAKDIAIQKYFIENPEINEELTDSQRKALKKLRLNKLDRMLEYSSGKYCLRHYMLGYFGENVSGKCDNCSSCVGSFSSVDVTTQAQKIFSCIKRVKENENCETVVKILKGEADDYILSNRLDEIKTFAQMKDSTTVAIKEYIDYFSSCGYIRCDREGKLSVTEKCEPILFEGKRIRKRLAGSVKKVHSFEVVDYELFGELIKLRKKLALKRGVPDYTVLTDFVIRELAKKKPCDEKSFLGIDGISREKYKNYGVLFISLIKKHCSED